MDEEPEQDFPVYESLYPEHENVCDHPPCEGETPQGQHICQDCIVIMHRKAPDECTACGCSLGS